MKKLNVFILTLILIIGSNTLFSEKSYGQVIFMSTDDTIAIVNKLYYYNVEVLAMPDDEKYKLLEAPDNMTIDSLTGEIRWIPGSIYDGVRVLVKATNSENESETHEFYVYVADGVECPSSVEAYWNLDEKIFIDNDTVLADYCGNNDAYVTKSLPLDTAGVVGVAQKFPLGDNSEIIVPDNGVFDWASDESFSVEFWFMMYPGDIDSTRVIIGRNQGGNASDPHWWIGLNEDDHLFFKIRKENFQTVQAEIVDYYLDYGWHHVVAVRNAETDNIYLYADKKNDVFVIDSADNDRSGPGFIADAPLCIGWLKPGPGDDGDDKYRYYGKLDEIVIYNEALSEQQAIDLWNNGKAHHPACPYGNFAPLFKTTPDTLVDEESPYKYQYLANDIDGDPLVYTIETKPDWLNHDAGTKTLSGTPSDNDVGIFDVSIKVNDGTVDVFQNFRITVNNINDKPVLSGIEGTALSYDENDGKVPVTSTVTLTDVDDVNIDSARISISANYVNGEDVLAFTNTANITGTWNASSGMLRLTGTTTKANYQAALRAVTYENTDIVDPTELTRTVRFTANDGELNSDPVTRDITVTSVNDCPVISAHASLSTPEEDTILIKLGYLTFTDVDNVPGDFSIAVASGTNYTYAGNIVTPALNFYGTLNVNVKLSDLECTVDYVLPITVTAANDPPEFNFASLPAEAYENQTYILTIRAFDIDTGDVVTYSVPQKPDWLNVFNDTVLTGIPAFIDVGANTVTIRISDSQAETDTTFIITVYSTNYIPHITSTPVTSINEDALYEYNITMVDTNALDPLFLSAPVLPDWLSLNTVQKRLEGIPTNDQVGYEASADYTVQLKVYDGKQDSTQTFKITVHNINDAPEIKGQPDTIITYPGSSVVINIDDLTVEDVDNLLSELKLIILPGTDYALSENTITVITDKTGLINVYVRVEDPGKLKDQDTLFVRVAIPSGNGEVQSAGKSIVRIYPSPAQDFVKFEILYLDKYILELIDITGKTVFQKKLSEGEDLVILNTSKLHDGIYYYKLYSNKSSYTGNITIRK
jgi:hypothetical protein